MRILFDTSVVLAALIESHPAHSSAYSWLRKVKQGEHSGCLSTHSLAELYNKLTRIPLSRPIPPREALVMVKVNVIDLLTLIALSPEDYHSILSHLASQQMIGGIVYDALIVHAGIKANADRILTLNPRHFRLIYPEVADRIVDPSVESAP